MCQNEFKILKLNFKSLLFIQMDVTYLPYGGTRAGLSLLAATFFISVKKFEEQKNKKKRTLL